MTGNTELKQTVARLIGVRVGLLSSHPFYGRLLLRLRLGFADCGTAYTDMENVVFDPAFVARLDDGELRFLYLHELMHCVLHHCTRGRTLDQFIYNIACDTVVNSLILESFGADSFTIAGEEVMHLAPDGREGRLYNAEEVYEMLMKEVDKIKKALEGLSRPLDDHSVWAQASEDADDRWDGYVRESARAVNAGSGIPYSIRRYLTEISHTPKTNWRQLLHDFIQHDRSDFIYSTPDHRFQSDIIMPSFCENVYGDKVEKLWVLVDTSASISASALTKAFCEIKDAIDQIGELTGMISFFDTKVSEPSPFGTPEELLRCKPVGGGGTSFAAIFRYLQNYFDEDDLPAAVIILTDGYSDFPGEDEALGIPVMWMIINSRADAPWGGCIHIDDLKE